MVPGVQQIQTPVSHDQSAFAEVHWTGPRNSEKQQGKGSPGSWVTEWVWLSLAGADGLLLL